MKHATIALGIIILALIPGCRQTVGREGTHTPALVPGAGTNVRYNGVALLDNSIKKKIAVQAADRKQSATGTSTVQVQVRNRTDFVLQIESRVQFFDKGKKLIDGPSAWQRTILTPNAITVFREHSTRGDVEHFYVEIREGR